MVVCTYHKWDCANCGGVSYVSVGNQSAHSCFDVDYVRCPWCNKVGKIDDELGEVLDEEEDPSVYADEGVKSLPEQPPSKVKK